MSPDCCVAVPHDTMGLSAVCECGISSSYSLVFLFLFNQCVQLVELAFFLYVFLLDTSAVCNVFVLYKKQYAKLFKANVK